MNDKKYGIFREGCRSDCIVRGVKPYAKGEKPLGLGEIHYTTGVIHYGTGEIHYAEGVKHTKPNEGRVILRVPRKS